MIRWAALLMSSCCLALSAAAGASTRLERIERCGTRCSQGLQCKSKPDYLFPPPCQMPPHGLNTSSVFHNISLSTVMRCEGRQRCSLHLRINALLQLNESIHGVSICTVTAGMMGNCRVFRFTRSSRQRMSGLQVEVENDCTSLSPNQQVQVMVKTVPSYCGTTWTGTYRAPECVSEDLRRHVPECITGTLLYDVNPERKELRVSVADMLEDHNYHLRLCYKDFICFGTEAKALIRKENPVKSAVLPYSRPLPCLCIEGWSAVVDALRVQVCPFKERLEQLWSGITFDPLEETLSWELRCPVPTVVSLCQREGDGACVDLPHASQNVSRGKVAFTEVDPHPHLCLMFTVGSQSWTRCPFAAGSFQVWDVVSQRRPGHEEVKLRSKVNAAFLVGRCAKSAESAECHITETHTVHAKKNTPVVLNMTEGPCDFCVQVKRLGVKYGATVIHCTEQCKNISPLGLNLVSQTSWDWTWVGVSAAVCLAGVLTVALVLYFMLTVHRSKKQKTTANEKQMGPALDCVVPALQSPPHRGILVPDSPQCGNTEKANLISE